MSLTVIIIVYPPKSGSNETLVASPEANLNGVEYTCHDIFYRKLPLPDLRAIGFSANGAIAFTFGKFLGDTLGKRVTGHIGPFPIRHWCFSVLNPPFLLVQNHQISPQAYLGHRVLLGHCLRWIPK